MCLKRQEWIRVKGMTKITNEENVFKALKLQGKMKYTFMVWTDSIFGTVVCFLLEYGIGRITPKVVYEGNSVKWVKKFSEPRLILIL